MASDFGPWAGVPERRKTLCAVVDCIAPGKEHACPFDGRLHHHGCIHYDCAAAAPAVEACGLVFRDGWGLLCDTHYARLVDAFEGDK